MVVAYCDLGKNMKSWFDKQVNNCVGAIVYVLKHSRSRWLVGTHHTQGLDFIVHISFQDGLWVCTNAVQGERNKGGECLILLIPGYVWFFFSLVLIFLSRFGSEMYLLEKCDEDITRDQPIGCRGELQMKATRWHQNSEGGVCLELRLAPLWEGRTEQRGQQIALLSSS